MAFGIQKRSLKTHPLEKMGNISARDCQWYYEDFVADPRLYNLSWDGGYRMCTACSNLIERHNRRPKPCQFSLEDLLGNPSLCGKIVTTERTMYGVLTTKEVLVCSCCKYAIGTHLKTQSDPSRPVETRGSLLP